LRVAAVSAAAALAIGLAWLWLRTARAPSAPPPRGDRSLVVLPAKVADDVPGGPVLGDGLVETLSVRLNKVPGIQVVTPAAAVAAADRDPDPIGAARRVGANLVVKPSIVRSGDRIRLIYSVWNVQTRIQEAGDTVDGSLADLFGVQDEFAAKLTTALKLRQPAKKTPTPTGLETALQ